MAHGLGVSGLGFSGLGFFFFLFGGGGSGLGAGLQLECPTNSRDQETIHHRINSELVLRCVVPHCSHVLPYTP